MNKVNNGRVDIKSADTTKLFTLYDKIPANQCVTFRNPTEGLWDQTPLSDAFFSRANIQIIQNGIRAGVYKLSNRQYVIGIQDCDTLKIIMRSVFLQYSANSPNSISEQTADLNKIVLITIDFVFHIWLCISKSLQLQIFVDLGIVLGEGYVML
jgi:hypothetical protein